MVKPYFSYAKTKAQISFAVTIPLLSKPPAIFRACTARVVSDLFGNHIVGFLMNAAHLFLKVTQSNPSSIPS